MSIEQGRQLIDRGLPDLSISEQCELLSLGRSSFYYTPVGESSFNLALMNRIDEIATLRPYYGSPRITDELRVLGYHVNRKRVMRLMHIMGLEAVYPKPRLSQPAEESKRYPYLLRGITAERPNHIWATDITYIRMHGGYLYLVAVIDWFSRYILSWRLSKTMDAWFCIEALRETLKLGLPEIFNSDQGAQFSDADFLGLLEQNKIRISKDGRGRAFDNIFTERFWRTLKYEEVYLKDYTDGKEAFQSLDSYIRFYNFERRHSSLGKATPAEIYFGLPQHFALAA